MALLITIAALATVFAAVSITAIVREWTTSFYGSLLLAIAVWSSVGLAIAGWAAVLVTWIGQA